MDSPSLEESVKQEVKWWHVPDEQIEKLVQRIGEEPLGNKKKTKERLQCMNKMIDEGLALESKQQQRSSGKVAREEDKWWRVSDQDLEDHIRQVRDEAQSNENNANIPPVSQDCGRTPERERQIHVRLNWLSRADPIPCKRTGKRHPAAGKDDDLITVYFHVVETAHRFSLNVKLDLRIGPDQRPPENCFTEKFGLGASTKGFADRAQNYDYKYRRWSPNAPPDWNPAWTDCLKARIEMATGLDMSRQRLLCHGSIVGDDQSTVRMCGITPGTELQVFTKREPSTKRQQNIILACSAKRQELEESRRFQEEARQRSEAKTRDAQHILRKREGIPKQCAMPPMIFQDCPNLIGCPKLKGNSIKRVRPFEETPIYHPPRDPLDRKLQRIRSLPAYIIPATKW